MLGDSSNVLINETAATIMGFTPESSVGQTITRFEQTGTTIGVVTRWLQGFAYQVSFN